MAVDNLLLVSYHYPPMGGSGVQRALKLARYLPRMGWQVHVLTAGHTHYPLMDPSLGDDDRACNPCEQDSNHITIHRVLGFEPGAIAAKLCRPLRGNSGRSLQDSPVEDRLYWRLDRWTRHLRLPETEMLWISSAVRSAGRIIRQHAIQAVVTTSPPHSIQRVGAILQRRWGLPWIADLRDPILDNFAYLPVARRADRYWHRLERMICTRASRVIVTCPELKDRLQQRYPDVARSRFATVTNGFDPADRPAETVSAKRTNGRFILGYVGSFYRDQTIEPLLKAVRQLTSLRRDIAARLELRVVGSVSAQQCKLLHDCDDSFLNLAGYRSHAESIREMAAADTLFLMTPTNSGGRYCLPAKTFEYLAFGNHIIAMVHPETMMAELLSNAGEVTLVEHNDVCGLSRAIETCFDARAAGSRKKARNPDVLDDYRRDRIARQFSGIVRECVCAKRVGKGIPLPGVVEGTA